MYSVPNLNSRNKKQNYLLLSDLEWSSRLQHLACEAAGGLGGQNQSRGVRRGSRALDSRRGCGYCCSCNYCLTSKRGKDFGLCFTYNPRLKERGHHAATSSTTETMSSAVKDNKTVNAESECNNEVKNLLNVKSQNAETCPHRKTPVSQDIGTLHYDGRWNSLLNKYVSRTWCFNKLGADLKAVM